MVKKVRKFAHTPMMRALLILIGGFAAIIGGIVMSPFMDFSPAVQAQTQCEQEYQKCLQEAKKQPPKKTPAQCEQEFKQCVLQKCPESKSRCTKTPECEAHCTESATSQGGIKTCCEGGPKHQNACPNKIDGKCSPQKTKLPGEGMKDMMMKDASGNPMLPMLPMPPMKMGGGMMMPPPMDSKGDCSSPLATYNPECSRTEAEQSPISKVIDAGRDLWNGLFGNEAAEEESALSTNTIFTPSVDANDTGSVQSNQNTDTSQNNSKTGPITQPSTFTQTSADLGAKASTANSSQWNMLESMKKALQNLLSTWF